jgi:hypothetical protein
MTLFVVYCQRNVFVAVLRQSRIVSDFPGSATVSVACVGVSPTQRYAADKFTRSMAIRACR